MSLLVFVEDIFAPEVTALTLKTSNFFLKPVLQRHLLSSLYKSNRAISCERDTVVS